MSKTEQQKSTAADEGIKQLVSTLPTKPDCNSTTNLLYQYQGFWYHQFYLEHLIAAQTHFTPEPNSTILCSYPKTGTTWLKALSFAITTRTHYPPSQSPLLSRFPHDCVPFFELAPSVARNKLLVATHIPYTSLPAAAAAASGCKLAYICRDPKDVVVSLWQFQRKQKKEDDDDGDADMGIEEAFEQFCEGNSVAGPYWDHVLGYWRASLEFPERVLFVRYEELKRETERCVKALADFLGCGFSLEEEKQGIVQGIIDLCSIESLKGLDVTKNGRFAPTENNSSFYRKGEVGDWRNFLTEEMGARLDKIMADRFAGSGLGLWFSASNQETTN
ncbi:unnamed protein product [Linum tenue]|uniref:Sulfotransferase n=1 Tax=Linum tenue TaxID=586396 RepID=A0AAV0QMQ2_9ROSI|nr:unnamed protein product [Linum tenue]